LAEPRLNTSPELGAALLALLNDPAADVQLQLACTLGEWHDPRAGETLGLLAIRQPDEPYLTAAVLSSTNENNLVRVLNTVVLTPRSELVSQLLTIAAAGKDRQVLNQALAEVCRPDRNGDFANWQMTAAAAAFAELRRRDTPLEKAVDANQVGRLHEMFAAARKIVLDDNAAVDARATAIGLLGQGHDAKDFNTLALLLAPKYPAEIQMAAINALGRSRDTHVAEKLLEGWQAYSPAARSQVLDTLLSRNAWANALLDQIEHGAVAASEIDATRRQRLTASGSQAIRDRAEKLLASSVGTRAKTVEEHQSVLSLPADSARGRQVFLKRCSSCHVLEGQGHAVGADLAAMGNKSPQALLIAILDPNRAVESRYVTYLAQLEDGQIIIGVLFAESGNSLTLRGPDGKDQVILRKDLEVLRNTGKSLMPEGLEKDISAQELADVIAFVGGFLPPSKSFAGNHPEVVRPDADDIVRLTASKASIYGSTVVFEPKYKNLGFWTSADDLARWSLEVGTATKYKVILDYACDHDAGNTFRLDVDDQQLSGTVKGTGSWDSYRDVEIGRIALSAGPHTLIFRSANPLNRPLLDLRSVRLVPIGN
jgi:putative heme-binding domain-containing protein